jgi:hypothetical protein
MKLWIMLAMFSGMLVLGTPLSAQDQPPSAAPPSPTDQSAPDAQPQTEPAAASPTSAPTPPPTQTQAPVPPPANPPNSPPNSAKKKRPATKGAHKVVVRNGGAKDESAQLTPAMTEEQEQHNRESTTRLLTTTDANLKSVAGRQLTSAQQTLLDQIHTYMQQSKEASKSGDLARAHTLAYKAHLLCDELMRK